MRWDKLPEADKQTLERLGDEFTTKEAKQGLSLSARPTNDRLLKWASLGLTEKVKQGILRILKNYMKKMSLGHLIENESFTSSGKS